MTEGERLAERFEQERPRLRAVAYRMLGSVADADEAVQDAWIRLSRTRTRDIENLGGWLTTVVTRLSLNVLRGRQARRETDSGVRVPEPLVGPPDGLEPEREALLAASVGLALMVVLETLAPDERVAFVLHDVFAVPFEEVATTLDRTPAAARQLASRARRRVRASAPEPDVGVGAQREVVEAFFAAARAGDLDRLVGVLRDDVVLRVDAGTAAPGSVVVAGAGNVARRALMFAAPERQAAPVTVNGAAGVVVRAGGRPVAVMAFAVVGGTVAAIDVLADPERLGRLDPRRPGPALTGRRAAGARAPTPPRQRLAHGLARAVDERLDRPRRRARVLGEVRVRQRLERMAREGAALARGQRRERVDELAQLQALERRAGRVAAERGVRRLGLGLAERLGMPAAQLVQRPVGRDAPQPRSDRHLAVVPAQRHVGAQEHVLGQVLDQRAVPAAQGEAQLRLHAAAVALDEGGERRPRPPRGRPGRGPRRPPGGAWERRRTWADPARPPRARHRGPTPVFTPGPAARRAPGRWGGAPGSRGRRSPGVNPGVPLRCADRRRGRSLEPCSTRIPRASSSPAWRCRSWPTPPPPAASCPSAPSRRPRAPRRRCTATRWRTRSSSSTPAP
jgi:RNA polymerase sigma-70 factor (ECF subfamily)